MNLISDKICVGNGIFFYFNDDGKLEIFYMHKILPVEKRNTFVLFIEWTELNWNVKDANWLYVSIFFKYMGWYLVVIGKLHNYECLIYILTGEVLNVTPNIFNK